MTISIKKIYFKAKHKRKFLIVTIFLIPVIFISYAIGSMVNYLNTLNYHYIYEIAFSEDEFIESDPELIGSAAENWSRLLYTYCFPQNLTGDGWDYYPFNEAYFSINPMSLGIYNESEFLKLCDIFNTSDPLNQIYTYTDTGHALTYASQTAIGEALKYAVLYREGKTSQAEEILQNIYKYIQALKLVSSVDRNGKMARYVLPDTPIARNAFKFFSFKEDYKGSHLIYNLTYVGPNGKEYTFWLETGTSVDLYITVFACLGITYLFVNNSTIRSLIREIVDSLLEYWIKVGWKYVDKDGKSHIMGAEAINIKPITDASYCLAFLLVGKTVNPDKWKKVYDTYAYDRNLARKVGKQSILGVHDVFTWASGYFNIELMVSIAFTLNVLETDPILRSYYRRFLNTLYEIVKYHRNAWFDTAYAMGMAEFNFLDYNTYIQPPKINLDSKTKSFIEKDVGDCLTRLAYVHRTGRNFRTATTLQSYEKYEFLSPIPGAPYPDAKIYDWKSKINLKNPFVRLISSLLYPEMDWTKTEGILDKPIPADWRRVGMFMWEYSPFDSKETPENTGACLPIPGDFTLPYWIGRYLNFSSLFVA